MLGVKIVLDCELQHLHVANSLRHATLFHLLPLPDSLSNFHYDRSVHSRNNPSPPQRELETTTRFNRVCVSYRCTQRVWRRFKRSISMNRWCELTRQNSAKVSTEQFKLAEGQAREKGREGKHTCVNASVRATRGQRRQTHNVKPCVMRWHPYFVRYFLKVISFFVFPQSEKSKTGPFNQLASVINRAPAVDQ